MSSHLFDIHTIPVVILLRNCGPPSFENKLVIEWSAWRDNTMETVSEQAVTTEPIVIGNCTPAQQKVHQTRWPSSLWSVTKRWSIIRSASWMFSSESWMEVLWLKQRILREVAVIWFSCCPCFYALWKAAFLFIFQY